MSGKNELQIPSKVQTVPRKSSNNQSDEYMIPSYQSIPICIIFSILSLATICTIESIPLPIFNENIGYATNVDLTSISIPISTIYSTATNMDNYSISAVSNLSILEWQFSQTYVSPNDRLLNPTLLWLLSVPGICLIYISIWMYIKYFHYTPLSSSLPTTIEQPAHSQSHSQSLQLSLSSIAQSSEWMVDDFISFTKGYLLTILLCRTAFIIVSARVSLPIPSFYDLCEYDINQAKCTQTNSRVIQEAYSATPNADIGLLCGTSTFLSFYIAGKLLQFVLQPFLQKRFLSASQKSLENENCCNSNGNSVTASPEILPIANDSENESNVNLLNVDKYELYSYFSNFQFISLYSLILLVLPFIPMYIAIFLSVSLIHDHCARDWDASLSVVCSAVLAYYIYTYYFENAFECLHINGNMSLSGIPKQSRTYRAIEKRIMCDVLGASCCGGIIVDSVRNNIQKN